MPLLKEENFQDGFSEWNAVSGTGSLIRFKDANDAIYFCLSLDCGTP